jgi:hypothetical protein
VERTRPDGRRWTFRRILFLGLFALVLFVGVALAGPLWWRFASDGDAVEQQGFDIEQMVASRLTRVRESEAAWGFVIEDGSVNVWLQTRLVPWLEHDGDLTLPEGWTSPQVRFGSDLIQIGVRSPFSLIVVIDLRPRIEDESVVFELVGTSIGSIPVPLAMGASMIPALGLGDGGEREPSMDRLSVPRLIELADGRQLWIEDVEVASDELGLRFRTLR